MSSAVHIVLPEITAGGAGEHVIENPILEADGETPLDLTGWGPIPVAVKLRQSDDTIVATFTHTLVPPAAAGESWKSKVSWSAAESAKLKARAYVTDIAVQPPLGEPKYLFAARIHTRQAVS